MKFFQTPILAGLGFTVCLAQPGVAQIASIPVGTVEARIDGALYGGETLDVPSEGTSTAEYRSFGPVTSLTIQAHDPRADSFMHNVLSIDISLMGSDASASIVDGTVSWWPQGMGEPFYLSQGNGTALEMVFETLSLNDQDGSATGRFSAQLCRQDDFFSPPDLNDCLAIEGTFDTALHKAD